MSGTTDPKSAATVNQTIDCKIKMISPKLKSKRSPWLYCLDPVHPDIRANRRKEERSWLAS
jgi:hypothetical protein